MVIRRNALSMALLAIGGLGLAPSHQAARAVEVGFGRAEITPDVKARPVWIAGYGNNRKATGVHDPLWSRAVVLRDGDRKFALVSVDLVGIQHPLTLAIREALPDYAYVLVSSTHNHEGPDVIGLWGPTERESGVDPAYLESVQRGVLESVKSAESTLKTTRAVFGTASDESLMRDSRLPIVKDGVVRVVRFDPAEGDRPLGLLVQFSCHPEDLESENTLITADFPYYTIRALEAKYGCPVAYFTGAVGGLMTGPEERFRKPDGSFYQGGDWEFARIHGEAIADLAAKALESPSTLALSPVSVSTQSVLLPLANPGFRIARSLGLLPREAFRWSGQPTAAAEVLPPRTSTGEIALRTEVAYLRLGDLHIAGIPGEIYPELVYGRYQEPVEAGADFPEAPLEPDVMSILPGQHKMIFGLANDEIGYIIPKRQWDEKPPFAYGRERGQYGEVNSVGPDVAPILMEALERCVAGAP